MKILVTGGSGRLGNVLVRSLLKERHEVRVLSLPHTHQLKAIDGLKLELITGNLLDKNKLTKAMEGVDIVFHLAAKTCMAADINGATWTVNVTGTRYVAEMARTMGVQRFIHVSTHQTLQAGLQTTPIDERQPLALEDPLDYYKSKAHAEQLILDMVAEGLPAIVVSPGTLIGPYDFGPSATSRLLLDLYEGRLRTFPSDTLDDYVDVRDVVRGMMLAMRYGEIGERYLLTGWMADIQQLAALIEEISGKKNPQRVLPRWIMQASLPILQAASKVSGEKPVINQAFLDKHRPKPEVSHQKAKHNLGFRPRSLKNAMEDTMDWFVRMGWIVPEQVSLSK